MSDDELVAEFRLVEIDCRRTGDFDDANHVRGAIDAITRGQLTVADVMMRNGREGGARTRMHEGSTFERADV